jgi:acyl-CoA thioester hydrolase
MAHKVFEAPLSIREEHLDTFGHVNNATYLQILEQARWDLITDNGYGLDYIRSSGKGPVILEISLRFTRELTNRKSFRILSTLESYEGKVAKMKQTIVNEVGEVHCEAHFVFGLFDLAARRLLEPTPEWKHAIGMEE